MIAAYGDIYYSIRTEKITSQIKRKYTYSRYLIYSRGTKVGKMLTLGPERYTAEFCMVGKVILWCI